MVIGTNVSSLNSIEYQSQTTKSITSSLEKISSGLTINKASDDASGIAIADKLRTQKTGMAQAIQNSTSAVAMLQIADKAMNEQSNILDVVKIKLIQAATATTSDEGREAITKDVHKLLTELDSIASQTNYNGVYLLQQNQNDQDASNVLQFAVGDTEGKSISTSNGIRANSTGLASAEFLSLGKLLSKTEDATYLTDELSRNYLKTIDIALTDLNSFRSDLGSTMNQIESSSRNLFTQRTNIASAESVIRDVDYGSESANFSKQSLIYQSNMFANAQANAAQDSVLLVLNTI